MSKFTVSAVLAILRVLVGVLRRASRLVYAVLDVIDDGCLNGSAARPEWYGVLESALSTLDSLLSGVCEVENKLNGKV